MSLPRSTYTNIMDDPNVDGVKYLESLLEELTKPKKEEKKDASSVASLVTSNATVPKVVEKAVARVATLHLLSTPMKLASAYHNGPVQALGTQTGHLLDT